MPADACWVSIAQVVLAQFATVVASAGLMFASVPERRQRLASVGEHWPLRLAEKTRLAQLGFVVRPGSPLWKLCGD